MKTSIASKTETSPTPAFRTGIQKQAENLKAAIPKSKSPKRDNNFSQSRDTREDRGARQMKTTHNAQTLPHPH
ncbi:MAG: hypothetical protein WCO56_04200 [Verrucomicrobiota bacterium]